MQGARIGDELEIGTGRFHLSFERFDLLWSNELISTAIEHKNLCLDTAGLCRFHCTQTPMKACNSLNINSLPCHIEDDCASHTIANGYDTRGANVGLLLQKVHR